MLHTREELKIKQALPLDMKIMISKQRIKEWVDMFGEDGVYVSFSGGKDSTVLLHIARSIYPNIKAMFLDTGLEYPEIRSFVKTFDNVDWVKPKLTFRQVIEKYGYPFISKEVSQKVSEAKSKPDGYTVKYFTPAEDGGKQKQYNYSKYKFLISSPYNFGRGCCYAMKKRPAHKYEKDTGRKPITGQMASESQLRTTTWLQRGCNIFDGKTPKSNPLSIWTEQDILQYIKKYNIPICSLYGDIVPEEKQESLFEQKLINTGVKRTGCMFCGYGCHLEKSPNRFEKMKISHPKQYDYIMRSWSKGGLGYKELIDWINDNSDLNIKY